MEKHFKSSTNNLQLSMHALRINDTLIIEQAPIIQFLILYFQPDSLINQDRVLSCLCDNLALGKPDFWSIGYQLIGSLFIAISKTYRMYGV